MVTWKVVSGIEHFFWVTPPLNIMFPCSNEEVLILDLFMLKLEESVSVCVSLMIRGVVRTCRVRTLLYTSHTNFAVMHVHDKKSALLALYKYKALQLEPEQPINDSLHFTKYSSYKRATVHNDTKWGYALVSFGTPALIAHEFSCYFIFLAPWVGVWRNSI